jgi:hypothetical protein
MVVLVASETATEVLKNLTFFLDMNGLGDTDGKGDVAELGSKYTF